MTAREYDDICARFVSGEIGFEEFVASTPAIPRKVAPMRDWFIDAALTVVGGRPGRARGDCPGAVVGAMSYISDAQRLIIFKLGCAELAALAGSKGNTTWRRSRIFRRARRAAKVGLRRRAEYLLSIGAVGAFRGVGR